MNPQYTDAWLAHFYAGYIALHAEPTRRRDRVDLRTIAKSRGLGFVRAHLGDSAAKPRILMVGCGDGLELKLARDAGFEVEGYDVDPDITAAVAAEHGVPVHHGAFEALDLGDGTLDAVWMDQVLEHPKNPADYLRTVHRLLRPGGVLYLGLPHIASFSNVVKTAMGRAGLKRRRRGAHYATRHHLTYFGARQLRRLLEERFDFDVVEQRGSPKPGRNPLTAWIAPRVPWADSAFVTIARRRS